jgi:hypothetical protein
LRFFQSLALAGGPSMRGHRSGTKFLAGPEALVGGSDETQLDERDTGVTTSSESYGYTLLSVYSGGLGLEMLTTSTVNRSGSPCTKFAPISKAAA